MIQRTKDDHNLVDVGKCDIATEPTMLNNNTRTCGGSMGEEDNKKGIDSKSSPEKMVVEREHKPLQTAAASIHLSKGWFIRYYIFRVCGCILSYIPCSRQALSFSQLILYNLNRANHSEVAYRLNKKKAIGGISNPVDFDSGYGYENSDEERRVALMYKAEIISGNYLNRESPALYSHAISVLSDLVEKNNVLQVVNFGVCYAHVDSVLAKKHNDVKFVGIDRSKAIKQLNEEEFRFDNLSFIAGDVMDWINTQKDLSDTLFYSMRTCVLLPQEFIEKLYKRLAERNCYLIVGFEPFGLSRKTNSFYEQAECKKESVLFRDTMYLHNYMGVLYSNGYEMKGYYIKTAHIDKDYRILSFIARNR